MYTRDQGSEVSLRSEDEAYRHYITSTQHQSGAMYVIYRSTQQCQRIVQVQAKHRHDIIMISIILIASRYLQIAPWRGYLEWWHAWERQTATYHAGMPLIKRTRALSSLLDLCPVSWLGFPYESTNYITLRILIMCIWEPFRIILSPSL